MRALKTRLYNVHTSYSMYVYMCEARGLIVLVFLSACLQRYQSAAKGKCVLSAAVWRARVVWRCVCTAGGGQCVRTAHGTIQMLRQCARNLAFKVRVVSEITDCKRLHKI